MSGFGKWLEERSPSGEIVKFLRRKRVPAHRHTSWYLFGGLTLFFFLIQVISGILLSLYYQPTPATAHESVAEIMSAVGFGWLVRGVHRWSSHLLIFSAMVHMTSKYFFRAYRKPRELTWISGVLLMLMLLGFAFTGHLLPWDTNGYFATQIGTEIPRSLPVIGTFLVELLRGSGEYVDATALTRLYSLHTVVLPLIAVGLILFHIVLNQFTGSAAPANVRVSGEIPFYPDFVFRDALAWLVGVMLLFSLVMFFPPLLGPKADMLASPPPGIRPEWYFLPLFQTIRVLPGTLAGINTEILINLVVAILFMGLICLPWIDRMAGRNGGRVWALLRFTGVVMLVYIGATILLAYLT